jgi:hypothetical protein
MAKNAVFAFYSQSNRKAAVAKLTKEVGGIHLHSMRLLFGDDIPRRLLLRFSPVKSTSALTITLACPVVNNRGDVRVAKPSR